MAAEPDRESKTERARQRWLGRWLVKLALWFVTLSFSAILIGGIVSVIAYRNLTGLANLTVSRFAQPYRVEFGRVDVSKKGLIQLEEVSVRPPKSLAGPGDEPWVTLAGADLAFDFAELRRERRFRSIVLRGPEIRIDDASLETLGLTGGNAGSGETAPPLDLKKLGRITDRIEVVGGRWVFDTSKGPRVSGTWDVTVPPIDFGAEEWLNLEPLALRLGDLAFGASGELGTIDRIAVTGRVRSDLRGIEIGELAVDDPRLKFTPAWLPRSAGESPNSHVAVDLPEPAPNGSADPFQVLIGALTIRGAALSMSDFDGTGGSVTLPELSLKTDIGWRGLTIEGSRIRSDRPLKLALSDLKVGGADDGPPLASIERLAVDFDPAALLARGRIDAVTLESPRFHLSPASLAPFRSGKPAPEAQATHGESAPWEIGALKITGGEFSARDWKWEERPIPAAAFKFDADLQSLSPTTLGLAGTAATEAGDRAQSLTVSDLVIDGREPDVAAVSIGRISAGFRLEALRGEGLMDRLAIEKPTFRLTDEVLPAWLAEWQPEPAKDTEPEARPGTLWTVGDLSITEGELALDTDALGGRLPKLEGDFSLAALNPEEKKAESASDQIYRLLLQRLRVLDRAPVLADAVAPATEVVPAAPPEKLGGLFPGDDAGDGARPVGDPKRSIAEQDVALLREISVDFTAAGLQRDQRIERIEVKGGEFQVGDALQRLVNGPAVPATEGAEPPPSPLQAPAAPPVPETPAPKAGEPQAAATPTKPADVKGWRVGEVVVTETQVRFQALIPQIEGLEFGIETKLQDIPLSGAGFLSQDQKQKVEIAGIEIRDPYDSFITVAFLPTIFVEFSLAGLVNQRIERIDLLNPAIHVGQGLFWWIDYQRNYRKQNEGVAFAGAPAGALGVGNAEAGEAGGATDWVIEEINAHFGKIVIAPAGQPIGIVPFPFSASTNLNKGEIALKLQIPKEQQYVYQFPDFELDLFGLEGNIEFNVPIKQQDNNLVQTFTLDRAVWKQHEAEELFLSVTYDTNGVYGRFGGTAYSGYAEGQFNVYLDDVGRWDAWIAGTNMNMGPITEVLTPENFLMEGKINAKLISEGKGLVFGETTGEVQALSPGRINVTKLDELIAELPDGWSQMKRSITQLGLETLKDFAYEGGRADLHFINQDGWLRLDLEGPTGSRKLEVYAHDWRKGQKPAAGDAEADQSGSANDAEAPVESSPQPDPPKVAAIPDAAPQAGALAQRPGQAPGRPNRIRR